MGLEWDFHEMYVEIKKIHFHLIGDWNDFRGRENVEKYMYTVQKYPFAVRFITLFVCLYFYNALVIEDFLFRDIYALYGYDMGVEMIFLGVTMSKKYM